MRGTARKDNVYIDTYTWVASRKEVITLVNNNVR